MLNIKLDYPSPRDEVRILDSQQYRHPIDSLSQAISIDTLLTMQSRVREVRIEREIREYIVTLVTATRQHNQVYLGASPRGSLALFHASQAMAIINGRDYVTPDDVKALVKPVLSHRLIIKPDARIRSTPATPDSVLEEALVMTPTPGSPAAFNGWR
jgi:MoxR-like ATPase